jgi:hypothetical protein
MSASTTPCPTRPRTVAPSGTGCMPGCWRPPAASTPRASCPRSGGRWRSPRRWRAPGARLPGARHDRLWAVGHLPIGFRFEPGLLLGVVAFQQPGGTAPQRAAYLRRLAAFPAYLDALAANAREGLAGGVVAPRVVVARTVGQVERLLATPVADGPALAPLAAGGDQERTRGSRRSAAKCTRPTLGSWRCSATTCRAPRRRWAGSAAGRRGDLPRRGPRLDDHAAGARRRAPAGP